MRGPPKRAGKRLRAAGARAEEEGTDLESVPSFGLSRVPSPAQRSQARKVFRRLDSHYPEQTTTKLSHRSPYELLVATVLSAQCTDKRVNAVTPDFFARYPDVAALAAATPRQVERLIRTCGLYRTKARNLVLAARALLERHGGQVPAERLGLEALPGVGRKTASVVLAVAHDTPALAVDTHVHRVANRLGLARSGKDRRRTEEALTALIPKRRWATAHHQLIHHGREVCRARAPRCDECFLQDVCEYRAEQTQSREADERSQGS